MNKHASATRSVRLTRATQMNEHASTTWSVRLTRAAQMNEHASATRFVRLTRAVQMNEHASTTRSVPAPCGLFFTMNTPVKLHTIRATFLSLLPAALLTHEPLFSTRSQMLLLLESFTATSAQNLPFEACLSAHESLLSSHGSIAASLCSDPPSDDQLPTLHRSQLQRLRSIEINGDFN